MPGIPFSENILCSHDIDLQLRRAHTVFGLRVDADPSRPVRKDRRKMIMIFIVIIMKPR